MPDGQTTADAPSVADVAASTGAASGSVPDVLAQLEGRVSTLEAIGKGLGDAAGLGAIVDPLAARLDALEARAAKWEEAHPIVGKLASVIGRLFPQEMK